MNNSHRTIRSVAWPTALAIAFLLQPSPVAAHCDSMDGPVVSAARSALESGDVHLVLVWVQPGDEPEIREAFRKTLEVRSLHATAQALADQWFFETVVRVHRQGEGAPYTGLKPAGEGTPDGIAAADRVLSTGNIDQLANTLADRTASAIRERFQAVRDSRDYATDDVAAGRRAVAAYVDYIHFVEAVHVMLNPEPAHGHSVPHPTEGSDDLASSLTISRTR